MKFTVHVELCSQLLRLADTILLGWTEEVPGAPTYGTDQQLLEHDFGQEMFDFLDWLVEHGETQWKTTREQATRGFQVEFKPFVRPLVLLGPGHRQDPFELGIEESPFGDVKIARLIALCQYALDDLDRVAINIPDEEWLLPVCHGRVVAATYGDLELFEMNLFERTRNIIDVLNIDSNNAAVDTNDVHFKQVYRDIRSVRSPATYNREYDRWTWRHHGVRTLLDDSLSVLEGIQKFPGVVVSSEVWTIRKVLLLRIWAIRLTTGKLQRRTSPSEVNEDAMTLDEYAEYLSYQGILSGEHAEFWAKTLIDMSGSAADARHPELERLARLLLDYFTLRAGASETIPDQVKEQIRRIRGDGLYKQQDKLGLQYQCLDVICWTRERIYSDPIHYEENIYIALDLIASLTGDEHTVMSMLRGKVAEYLSKATSLPIWKEW